MRKRAFSPLNVLMLAFLLPIAGLAQNGVGIRFASNINYYPRAQEYGLVTAGYTTGVFGVFWSSYTEYRGMEVGINLMGKSQRDGGFKLPVVMSDFSKDQDVGLTGIEMDLKVGPRFGPLNPKIGYVFGRLLQADSLLRPGLTLPVNKWYLQLPFGLSTNLPTNFGTVGFGAYYYVGVLNVLKNPRPGAGTGGQVYDGGRWRSVNLEITVTFNSR